MMRRTVLRWAAPGLGLLALLVGGPLGAAAQGAEGFKGTFGALASADAVRVTWLVPHAPVSDTVFDAGGPSAQATLDSLGASQAWASYPYPGENVVTGPAIIAGASGGQINLPAYPFWVGSDYPTTPTTALTASRRRAPTPRRSDRPPSGLPRTRRAPWASPGRWHRPLPGRTV
jgi:hypothetical protein